MERSFHNISIVHIFSGDLWAGAEVLVYNLLSSLKDRPGIRLLALSMNEGVLTEKLREEGIETHVIPESEHNFIQIFLRARELLKDKRPDIIHSHRYKENLLAFLLGRFLKPKALISTVHGLPEPGGRICAKGKVITRLNRYLLRKAFRRVIAVSHEIKDTLIGKFSFSPERVSVIHNGIRMPDQDEEGPLRRGSFHIGTVGRMVPVKDFGLFLEVAAQMKRLRPDIRFSILGNGPLRESLLRKAEELRILDVLKFLDSTPDPFPFYRSIDLFLNTSLHEGIPLSLLEVMACGRAVVAPHVGGIPEVITDGEDGFLVKERKPEGFVRACLKLVEDRDLLMRLSRNARKKIEAKFHADKMAESYQLLYQEMVS